MSYPHQVVDVAAAVITRADGSFLLARRPEGKPYSGYWEFPGGKVNGGESLKHALDRELQEELAIHVQQAYPWITRIFTYSHATVRLCFYRVVKWHGEPQPCEKQELSWQSAGNVTVEPMLPANAPILRALRLPPIYAITNAAEWGTEKTLTRVERALQDGTRLLQVREKAMAKTALSTFTHQIVALAHHYHADVLLNVSGSDGSSDLNASCADGIHLSSAQLMSRETRPDAKWCGASCHNAEELARAEQLGLDFAVLAPVLPTLSHPGMPSLGWRTFATLIRNCSIPVYALGGLGHEDLTTAWEHGAHGIAIMRAMGR
jgi:8-oxo-dGTP diphosphatase